MQEVTYREKVIWAAGFLDGEACIAIAKSKSGGAKRKTKSEYMCVRVSVGQRTPEVLQVLQELFGGTISLEKSRPIYKWVVQNKTAASCLEQVLPYLVGKKSQAEVALRFQSRRGVAGSRRRDLELDYADFQLIRDLKRPWNAIADLVVELKARK